MALYTQRKNMWFYQTAYLSQLIFPINKHCIVNAYYMYLHWSMLYLCLL